MASADRVQNLAWPRLLEMGCCQARAVKCGALAWDGLSLHPQDIEFSHGLSGLKLGSRMAEAAQHETHACASLLQIRFSLGPNNSKWRPDGPRLHQIFVWPRMRETFAWPTRNGAPDWPRQTKIELSTGLGIENWDPHLVQATRN